MNIIAQNNRVYLRELEESDWKAVNLYASDLKVVAFQAWGPHSEKDSKDWVNLALKERSLNPRRTYYWGICLNKTDTLIGGIGIHRAESTKNSGTAEIGYSIRPDHWHQGLGRDAVRLAIEYIFGTSDLHRLTAHCRDENHSSVRLLEAVGFRREGHFLQDTWVRGKLMNSYWYALLKQDFLKHGQRDR